jgi:hypothetical protein
MWFVARERACRTYVSRAFGDVVPIPHGWGLGMPRLWHWVGGAGWFHEVEVRRVGPRVASDSWRVARMAE